MCLPYSQRKWLFFASLEYVSPLLGSLRFPVSWSSALNLCHLIVISWQSNRINNADGSLLALVTSVLYMPWVLTKLAGVIWWTESYFHLFCRRIVDPGTWTWFELARGIGVDMLAIYIEDRCEITHRMWVDSRKRSEAWTRIRAVAKRVVCVQVMYKILLYGNSWLRSISRGRGRNVLKSHPLFNKHGDLGWLTNNSTRGTKKNGTKTTSRHAGI